MKLKQKEDNSNTLGIEKAREFTIDTSNQMIVSILRDRLYSNKIGAVCREVASNSRDANREAGRESKPIVIEIGNNQSLLGEEILYISFQDNGIGISPERIDNVFLKYGSSTKRDNNNQTGGFGIGAKTPFAYNNEFIIETISEKSNTENIKHTYQAIILNQNGTESSQLIHISQENTKEQTGTKIIVPLKDVYDRNDFETEVFKATILWDVLPELKGFSSKYPKLDTIFNGDKWNVIGGEYSNILGVYQNDFVASVDGILYTIKTANISDSGKYPTLKEGIVRSSRETYYHDEDRTNVILKFETGELTLSASREDVEMTDENLKLIESRLAKMEKEILKKGEELLESKKTILSKTSFINNVVSTNSSDSKLKYLSGIKLFKYISASEGLPKTYKDLFFAQAIYKIEDPSIDRVSLTKKNLLESVYITLEELKACQIIFKSDYTRMNYRQSETLKRLNKPLLFVNISDDKLMRLKKAQEEATNVSKSILNQKDCLEVLAEENIDILKYEEVEKAKIVRQKSDGTAVKKNKDIKKLYARHYMASGGWNKEILDFNKSTKEIEGEIDCSNTILLNMSNTTICDINILDRVHISYERVIEQFIKRENDDSMSNFMNNIPKGNLLKTLRALEFNVMVLKHSDYEELNKKPYLTLESAINKIAKDTKNRKFLKAILKESHFAGVTALHSNDSTYTEYSGKLGRAYLSLVDFNLDDYKVVNPNKIKSYSIKDNEALKDNKLYSFWDNYAYRDTLKVIAELVQDDFKMKMFEGYLSEAILETQEEIMKEKYPTIHYVFNEVKGYSSWSFSEYDTKNNDREIGQKILQKDLLKLIEQELKSKK
jgi:hypothetical protein